MNRRKALQIMSSGLMIPFINGNVFGNGAQPGSNSTDTVNYFFSLKVITPDQTICIPLDNRNVLSVKEKDVIEEILQEGNNNGTVKTVGKPHDEIPLGTRWYLVLGHDLIAVYLRISKISDEMCQLWDTSNKVFLEDILGSRKSLLEAKITITRNSEQEEWGAYALFTFSTQTLT